MPPEPTPSLPDWTSYDWYLWPALILIVFGVFIWLFMRRRKEDEDLIPRNKPRPPVVLQNRSSDSLAVSEFRRPLASSSCEPDLIREPDLIPGWFAEFPQQIIERLDAIEQSHRKTLDLIKQMLEVVRENEAGKTDRTTPVQSPQREELRPRISTQEILRCEPAIPRMATKISEVENLGERFLVCCQESNFFFKKAWERFIDTLSWQPQVQTCWYDRMTTGSGLQLGEAGEDTNKVDCRLLYAQSDQRICYLFSGFVGTVNPKPEEFLYCELQGSPLDRMPERITTFIPPVIFDRHLKQKGLIIYGN